MAKKDTLLLDKLSFVQLINTINAMHSNLKNTTLFAVKDYKSFNDAFIELIFSALKKVSAQTSINRNQSLRNDLNLNQINVTEWVKEMASILRIYEVTDMVFSHEFDPLNTVEELLEFMRKKVKPERLYALAEIKKWIKDQRGDNLSRQWFEINDGEVITTDLGISDLQLKKLPAKLTSIAKEFKSDAKITLSDLSKDDIGSKTVGECADYVLEKAEVKYT